MTTIDLSSDELEIEVRRTEDEYGHIQLRIATTESERIVITVGRFYDDAATLANELERAAKEARQIVNEWKDLPDEHDGFVFCDRGKYVVQLEGVHWNGDKLVSISTFPNREYRTFPSRDIATYELAAAMASSGIFPNAWYEGEQSYQIEIHDDVRAYHDEGGDKLLPLVGVEYEPYDDVIADGLSAYIIRDYGSLGVVYVLSGDDEERFTDDRATITPCEESDDED